MRKARLSAGLLHTPRLDSNQHPPVNSPEIELSLGRLASVWGTSEIFRKRVVANSSAFDQLDPVAVWVADEAEP
jgi:hypothetical protein